MNGASPRCLVVAKAPVPGLAKTRLGAVVGNALAAEVAAAALLDTLDACEEAFGAGQVHIALVGDLDRATRGGTLTTRLAAYHVFPQHGAGFAERLAHAHADVARCAPGAAVLQIGMDTPQVTSRMLWNTAALLAEHPAVLGPAEDGGWWALALRDPMDAAALAGVPMSTPDTCDRTRVALVARGVGVGLADALTDVDTAEDADVVAALVPHTRFGRAWAGAGRPDPGSTAADRGRGANR